MQVVMTEKDPDQELVEKASGGDRRAFDRLLGCYTERLRASVESWARFQLGPSLDSEEILQETFTVAPRAWAWYRRRFLSRRHKLKVKA